MQNNNTINLFSTVAVWLACGFFLLRGGDMNSLPFTWNNIVGSICLLIALMITIWQVFSYYIQKRHSKSLVKDKSIDEDKLIHSIVPNKQVCFDFSKMSPGQINAIMSGLKELTPTQIDAIKGDTDERKYWKESRKDAQDRSS